MSDPNIARDFVGEDEIEYIDLDAPDDATPTPWRVDNPEKAAWAMRKLAYWKGRSAEVDSVVRAEVDRIHAWAEAEKAPFQQDINFFEHELVAYLEAVHADDESRKSLTYPAGIVKRREGSYSVEEIDEQAFIAWAQANVPALVRTPEPVVPLPKIAKTEIPKAIKDKVLVQGQDGMLFDLAGDEVPGILYKRAEPSFSFVIEAGEK